METERLHRLALEGDRDALRALVLERRRANDEDAVRALLGQLGQPLSGWLDRSVRKTGEPGMFAVSLVDAVLAALEPVHARGEVRLALRPSAIFLARKPEPAPWFAPRFEVLDLGPVESPLVVLDLSTSEHVRHAPGLAPGERDPRHDVYAVGLILYELLAGRPARPSGMAAALNPARMLEPLTAPGSRLPSNERHLPLERITMRALSEAPAERFADAAAFRTALTAAAHEPPWLDGGVPLPTEPPVILHYGLPPERLRFEQDYNSGPRIDGGSERGGGGLKGWLRRLFGR